MSQGYCPKCQTNVYTTKNYDYCAIIFWFFCGVFPGIICLISEMSKPNNICSNCGSLCGAPHYNQHQPQDPRIINQYQQSHYSTHPQDPPSMNNTYHNQQHQPMSSNSTYSAPKTEEKSNIEQTQAPKQAIPSEKWLICSQCGQRNKTEAQFCAYCGNSLR